MTDNDTQLQERKEQLYQQLQETGKNIGAAIRELKDRRAKRNELTKQAQEQKTVRKDLSKVIKEKIAEVKSLREKRGERPAKTEQRESPGKLRMEIQKLEHKLETSAMDFTAEQKLTKILKEKKAQLGKMGGDHELDGRIRELSKEIDKLKKESDVAHAKVTEYAKESQQHHETILSLSAQIEEWKKREEELQKEYNTLKEQLHTSDLPTKKPKYKKSEPAQPSAEDKAVLEEKAAEVEQKVKDKKKLTTEDLLAFQARK